MGSSRFGSRGYEEKGPELFRVADPMTKIRPHGCAYGLKSSKGQYMNKKPWSIASPSSMMAEDLMRRCDGSHRHVEARGRDCKQAEDYTDDFAG
eukprot:1292528-Pyramimonas_sp.AAC.1